MEIKISIKMRPLFASQKINALRYSDEFIALAHHPGDGSVREFNLNKFRV